MNNYFKTLNANLKIQIISFILMEQKSSEKNRIQDNDGYWNTAPDGGFVFDYVANNETTQNSDRLAAGYEAAKNLNAQIGQEARKRGGLIAQGVYILKPEFMIQIINSIKGTTQIQGNQRHQLLIGTPMQMCAEYFRPVFAGAKGNVDLLTEYITGQLSSAQNAINKQAQTVDLGILVIFNTIYRKSTVISISYMSVKGQSKAWIENLKCGKTQERYQQELEDYRVRWSYYDGVRTYMSSLDD